MDKWEGPAPAGPRKKQAALLAGAHKKALIQKRFGHLSVQVGKQKRIVFLHGYLQNKDVRGGYITGADATVCVKSSCFNMTKAGYAVHVISDSVTSYDLKKLPEMLTYYAAKGCEVRTLGEYQNAET